MPEVDYIVTIVLYYPFRSDENEYKQLFIDISRVLLIAICDPKYFIAQFKFNLFSYLIIDIC